MVQKNANDILELYKNKLEKIPNGSIRGICVNYLPLYIISNNNQVSKLRKRLKVLQVPEFGPLTKEEKYKKVLLFYPLRKGEVIDSDRLGKNNV